MKLRLTLWFSPAPRSVIEKALTLDAPCSVMQAITASGLLDEHPSVAVDLAAELLSMGIWGEKASAGQLLADLDRIEIYRALAVDPKLARRRRFAKQGARTTGLFAKRRPGAKPGY